VNSLKLWFADLLHDAAWALERQAIRQTLVTIFQRQKMTVTEKLRTWFDQLPPDEQRRIGAQYKRRYQRKRRGEAACGGPFDERQIH